MNKIYLAVVLIILLSEGTGLWINEMLGLKKWKFSAPIGFAVMLAAMQLLYYPVQLANGSFKWIIFDTLIVLLAASVFTVITCKELWNHLKQKENIIIFVSMIVFLVILRKCYIDLDFADSATYLNYIAMNINTDHLNLFNLTNGLRGSEWDVLYLFQGYYHFGSFFSWLVNIPYYVLSRGSQVPVLVASVYGLGLLYSAFSSMLIVNIVDEMNIHNKVFHYVLLGFTLFFTNCAYWDIPYAFYGNTWRGLYITMLIFVIYLWAKTDHAGYRFITATVVMAGLSCSSSYLFMGFAVLYALAAYLFYTKRKNALLTMAKVIFPLVLYVCAFVSRSSQKLSAVLLIMYLLLIIFNKTRIISLFYEKMDTFLKKHVIAVFYVGIPVFFAVGSLALKILSPGPWTNYSWYFNDFKHMDMIYDYLFKNSTWVENILNIFRWAGVCLVIMKAKSPEDQWIRHLSIILLVFFLNPLCMILLMKTIAGIVFYRNFMTLFNAMTETVFFIYLYRLLEKRMNWSKHIVEAGLITAVVMGHLGSYIWSLNTGIYWVYIKGGKDLDPVYKIEADEYNAIQALKSEIEAEQSDHQPVLVSQSNATLTYIPQAYQIFNAREVYYDNERVDEEFYQISRRHFTWQEENDEDTPDYSGTCGYLNEYHTDYVLLQYWENPEFDSASDACSVTVYTGSKYKVKRVE